LCVKAFFFGATFCFRRRSAASFSPISTAATFLALKSISLISFCPNLSAMLSLGQLKVHWYGFNHFLVS
jgi:hypothetical protein